MSTILSLRLGALVSICFCMTVGLAETPPVLVTRQLAEAYNFSIGDTIRLATEPSGDQSREYRIVDIYEPTPDPFLLTDPRHEVRLRLGDRDFPVWDERGEAVQRINLLLTSPSSTSSVVDVMETVRKRWQTVVPRPTEGRRNGSNPFVILEQFHWAISIVTVFGASAFLLALMILRSEERREILGVLRLIGVSRRRVLIEVLLEGLAIAAVGAVGGILLALACQNLANMYFQHHYDTTLVFLRVSPAVIWKCLAIALPMGLATSLIASWHLLRREVLALIRA
jgi:putative ABC transport system permease protein